MNDADIKLYMPVRCYVNNMSDVLTPTPPPPLYISRCSAKPYITTISFDV